MNWWRRLWEPEERYAFTVPESSIEPDTDEEPPQAPPKRRKLSDVEYREKLERQKNEAVEAAWAKLAPLRDEHVADQKAFHDKDYGSFSIRCERTADFMTLTITRLGRAEPSVIDDDQREERPITVVKRVNLALVTGIDLNSGQPPAHEQKLTASISYTYPGGTYSSWPVHVARDGEEMVAHLGHYLSCYTRAPWEDPPDKCDGRSQMIHSYGNDAWCDHRFPHPAEDDVIYFRGLGASIRAPFGRGEEALAEVMRAIGQKAAA